MKTIKKPKMIFTGFRLPEDVLKAAKKQAASQHRSFANYLHHLISLDLEKKSNKKDIDCDPAPAGLG